MVKKILDSSNNKSLIHTKVVADTKDGLNVTFHNFGRVPPDKRSFIDYIFVSPKTKVKLHSVLPEKLDDVYISDHAVVKAFIEI